MNSRIQKILVGEYGCEVITDTASHSPPTGYKYRMIFALEDSVIDTLTETVDGDSNSMAGETLPKGSVTPTIATVIKLTSGAVRAYLGPSSPL